MPLILPKNVNVEIGPDDVVIAPQPGPQTMFLRSKADITVYGGAAGGGYKLVFCGIINSTINLLRRKKVKATIYGLIDPRTQELRYIGRTIQRIRSRLQEHITTSKRNKDKCSKGAWIRELLSLGMKPEVFEIEIVAFQDMGQAEAEWVQYFRYIGADLLNDASPLVGGTRSHIIEWTDELDKKLGKISDSILALELGIDRKSVEYRRLKLGISRCPQANFVVPPMGGWNRIEWEDSVTSRFGTLPDYILASELGVDKSVIARARRRMGIPSFAEQNGNLTRFKKGNPHPRWSKIKNVQSMQSIDE